MASVMKEMHIKATMAAVEKFVSPNVGDYAEQRYDKLA